MRDSAPAIYRDYWSGEGDKTLAEHAEEWWEEKGTKAWKAMYQRWIVFAFEGWS